MDCELGARDVKKKKKLTVALNSNKHNLSDSFK